VGPFKALDSGRTPIHFCFCCQLQKLSTADKFALAVELWDELSSNHDEIPVTEEQLNGRDRRFEEYRQDPDKVVTWEEAKARILSGRR
jgi:putative addiction module component (TIGR02574 family)